MCRNAAVEVSSLKPILDKHNVKLVGVGLGYDSLKGFLEGKYWRDNLLYVDDEKKLYKALQLGKNSVTGLFDPKAWKANKETSSKGISGNLSGDGMQMGGTYVVDNGTIKFEYQQQYFGDHPELKDILKALAIPESELSERLTEFKEGK